MTGAVDHLLHLVAIPSVSSMSNRPVIEYAAAQLDPNAWNTRLYPYRDPAGVEKLNLVAISAGQGTHPAAELLLVCHTDTVPFDSAWPEAVNPKVRKGKLYGRGSCDVKGFLACVLAAAVAASAQAAEYGIPVMNQNRFLYYTGFYDQAKR